MKEQLISFETAKLAKEKGFTWKDFEDLYEKQIYIEGMEILASLYNKLNNEELVEPNVFKFTISNGYVENQYLEGLIMCSTQSLLQKWLREVHKIHISMDPELDVWVIEIRKLNGIDGNPAVTGYLDLEYKSYEEALEVGLQEALKLIP